MKITPGVKVHGFILAAVFSAGLGFATSASAQWYLFDLNSKTVTNIGGQASGINESGQVVGNAATTAGAQHAFITGPNGMGMRDLGTLGGTYSYAYGINDAGQVVGGSTTLGGAYHAFITGPDGMGMRDLGTLDSADSGARGHQRRRAGGG
jgi:probable HAF family extracellular repeat protein